MKTPITFLMLFFSLSSFAQNDWTTILSGGNISLEAIFFKDSLNGLLSSGSAYTYKTSDGGVNWNGTSSYGIRDFSFYNNVYGYGASLVGASMTKTTDGGINWSLISPPTSNSLWGVSAPSANTAYFVGTGGVFWKTTNGGLSVTVGNSGTTNLLTDVVFTNETIGYIAEQGVGVKKTTNGGISWTTVCPTPSVLLTKMYFVNEYIGFAVGSGGSVFKTSDGGNNWSSLITNSTSYLQGVNFYDENSGIVVGSGGTILYTNDGGSTWYKHDAATSVTLNNVFMLSSTSAVVIGDETTILKNSNIVLGMENIPLSTIILLSPNPATNNLTITCPTIIKNIEIVNLNGQAVYSKVMNLDPLEPYQINTLNLPNGVYFVRLLTENGIVMKKFVKE